MSREKRNLKQRPCYEDLSSKSLCMVIIRAAKRGAGGQIASRPRRPRGLITANSSRCEGLIR